MSDSRTVVLGRASTSMRLHLVNLLGILAREKDALRIERGSPDDKMIQAARRAVQQSRDGTMLESEIAMEETKIEHG